MSATAAWIAAANKPDARPIFVYQIPDLNIYFASVGGHYPLRFAAGASEPHHPDLVEKLPTFRRSIQNVFSGRTLTAFGSLTLIDDGRFDAYFGDYTSTLRGKLVHCWVTFDGLAPADAYAYMSARIVKATAEWPSRLVLDLTDASANWPDRTATNPSAVVEIVDTVTLEPNTYYMASLASVVKQRLLDAGLVYPDDFDVTAWTTWDPAGGEKTAGMYIVSGSWPEGKVLDILDKLLADTLTWYGVSRTGKFYIAEFKDLGGSPTVNLDLTANNALFEGGRAEMFEPVFRKQKVKYSAGSATITKTVNLATSHIWWPSARDGESVDPGITNSSDADSLCARRLLLLSSEHLITTVKTDARLLACDLGDVVKLDLGANRYPAVATQYHKLIGIDEDPNTGVFTATLWTFLGSPPQT